MQPQHTVHTERDWIHSLCGCFDNCSEREYLQINN